MLNIKKYTDGRFFDTMNKRFLKPDQIEDLIKKGEAITVVLTKTGKDITDAVIAEFSKTTGIGKGKQDKKEGKDKSVKNEKKEKKSGKEDHPFLNTEGLKKWVSDAIDKRMGKILDAVNLPTKDQVVKLDATIRELNKKIEALEKAQGKETPPKKAVKPRKKTVKKVETPVAETSSATADITATADVKPAKEE